MEGAAGGDTGDKEQEAEVESGMEQQGVWASPIPGKAAHLPVFHLVRNEHFLSLQMLTGVVTAHRWSLGFKDRMCVNIIRFITMIGKDNA